MRRTDREIKDNEEILEIIKKCDVCRVAFFDVTYPYIIPMNFGVVMNDGKFKLYFHCATVGTKLDLLKKNANVAFEMDCSHNLLLGDVACASTMEFESVCGNGTIRILPEEAKIAALTAIMNQYQSGKKHEFRYNELKAVEVLELNVNEIHGKHLKKQNNSDIEKIGTLSCAMKYGKEGKIDAWLQKFLHSTGANLALASGLLHEKRYYLGPVKMSMQLFDIPPGAPDYLTSDNDIAWFFQVADRMVQSTKDGWDMPPLIVNYANGVYEITDGRHRYESFRKLKADEVPAVIWTSSEKDYMHLLSEEKIMKL